MGAAVLASLDIDLNAEGERQTQALGLIARSKPSDYLAITACTPRHSDRNSETDVPG